MRRDPRHFVYVLRRHRLFEPEWMIGFQVVGDAYRAVCGQLPVRSYAHLKLVAHRAADALEYPGGVFDFP